MFNSSTVVGLDVSKEIIAAAILPPDQAHPSDSRKVRHKPGDIEKFVRQVTRGGPATFVYEAGFSGYELQRQISALGHHCVVIAPSMTPQRPGDRVKTDRRDAEKLARLYRAGELTEVRIPTREEEAARDFLRAREDALEDRLRAHHRLVKFLIRHGRVYEGGKSWSKAHRQWLRSQHFDLESSRLSYESYVQTVDEREQRLEAMTLQVSELAEHKPYKTPVSYLRCLKGVDVLTAMTMLVEVQQFRRFETARHFMGYTGMVPSEYTTSFEARRGRITKTGNAHLRWILGEAAWHYRRRGLLNAALAERRKGCPAEVVQIAKKAEDRLHRKFWRMISRGKPSCKVVVAVARELAGFVWAISRHFPAQAA